MCTKYLYLSTRIKSGFNRTRLAQSGYENAWGYFWGKRSRTTNDENEKEMTSMGEEKN